MFQAFVFSELAITVRHWYEIGFKPNESEHGIRIEVRRLKPHPRRGSLADPQIVEFDEIIWRGDLFDLIGDEPGSYGRAHHHTDFDGFGVQDRAWDDNLTADPIGWTAAALSNIDELAARAGFPLEDPAGEADDVREHLPLIVEAMRRAAPTECRDSEHCLRETRDTRTLIEAMMVERQGTPEGASSDPRVAA